MAATGALPDRYPHGNTVRRNHVTWPRDGTQEAVAERLTLAVRAGTSRRGALLRRLTEPVPS